MSHLMARARLARRMLFVVALASLSLAGPPTEAKAGETIICAWAYPVGSWQNCPPGARHTLTAVYTHSSYGSCSGAWTNPPGDFYASYACQGLDSSHPYNAGNLLYGASHSHYGYANWLSGRETW